MRRLVMTGLVAGGLTMGALAGPAVSGALTPKAGSTLTVALPPGPTIPTSVFPFYSAHQCTTVNIDYWNLEVRPGYWFGLGNSVALNSPLSVLNPVSFSTAGGNTVATITTKNWKWSDGAGHTATMDAQNIAFFMNMDQAQSKQGANSFCGDAPGFGIPDQIVSVTEPSGLTGDTVKITFQGSPSHEWLIYNELSQIVPLATAWDTTGSGSAGCSTENFNAVSNSGSDTCSAVFNHLSSLQMNDPIWNWSDGPYRQKSAQYNGGSPDGNDVQVANTDYSGPVKAHAVKTIDYKPYTLETSEFSDLQKNKLDFGYADPTDVKTSPGPGKAGKNLKPHMTNYNTVGTVTFGVFYWMFNFDNNGSTYESSGKLPTWANLNNLTYFRAALQQSENQAVVIKHVLNGYGVPTFSAIPEYPHNSFSAGVHNPYPYSTTKGKAIMKAHGWNTKVFPATCAKTNCGSAANPIKKGQKAVLQLLVPAGDNSVKAQTQYEVNSIRAGSDIQVKAKFDTSTNVQNACFGGSGPDKAWQLCGYGGWIYAPDYYPSGEVLFAKGSGSNSGGYSSTEMNSLIAATTTDGNTALNAINPTWHTSFAEFSASNLPFLWQPTPAGFIEQAKSVKGSQPPNPLGNFNPEYITAI
jgi:peptide/nickel transport system substrate-binding protein